MVRFANATRTLPTLGADGFLHTTVTREHLVEALRTAAAGESVWTREELHRASRSLSTPQYSGDIEVSLTTRGIEVLTYICAGSTNDEIAEALNVSVETAKDHVQHTLRELRVGNRTQAVVWAVRKGLV